MKAQAVAEAISEHYNVSVICDPTVSEKEVTGRIVTASLQEAINALCFLTAARYRSEGQWLYMISQGVGARRLVTYPSYGATFSSGQNLVGGAISIEGDRIFASVDDTQAAELGQALGELGKRRSLLLEVVMVDTSTNTVDRINEWLDTLTAAAGYYKNNLFVPGVPGAGQAAAAAASAVRRQGVVYNLDIQTALTLLDLGGQARIESREQLQVMSGSRSQFEVGQVVADVSYAREEYTGQQLVSRIERRTVGLTLSLVAHHFGESRWHLDYRITDSSLERGQERRAMITGERLIQENESWTLLASFTRNADSRGKVGVPILAKLPGVGRAFQKQERRREVRQLMVLARPLQK